MNCAAAEHHWQDLTLCQQEFEIGAGLHTCRLLYSKLC